MQPENHISSKSPLPGVLDGLRLTFGPRGHWKRRDPVGELIWNLLAQNTGGPLTDQVFARLRQRFTSWRALADARADEILPLIAPVARSQTKAEVVPAVLRSIRERSATLRLEWLEKVSVEEGMAWMEELPGVPSVIAAAVLNLSTLQRRIFVGSPSAVRVIKRLGLAADDDDARGVREAVMDMAPSEWGADEFAELHRLLARLSETTCLTMPECGACPLRPDCRTGRRARPVPSAGSDAANENLAGEDRLDAYLRRRIQKLERQGVSAKTLVEAGVSWGCAEIDGAFIGCKLPPGVHQTAGAQMEDRSAALLPVFATAIRLGAGAARPRILVVQEADAVREHGELHGPGLQAIGLDPSDAAFVRARDGVTALEVADEAVRGAVFPVVLLELRRGAGLADLSVTRRFNLAARRAGAFLFLVTPDLQGTSAAITRWSVSATDSSPPRRRVGPPSLELELARNRAGQTGRWSVEWSPASLSMRLASRGALALLPRLLDRAVPQSAAG